MQELQTPSPLRVDPAMAAEERSYERAYNRAKKDAAQAKGAADGMADALQDSDALQRARQRALSADQPKPALPKVEPPAKAQQFVQISARAKNYRVPDPQWYSLSPTGKSEYLDAVDGAEQKKADDNLALQSVNQVLDLQEKDRRKVSALEARMTAVETENRSLKQQLAEVNTTAQIEVSQAQAEAESRMAQLVINLQAVGAAQEADRQRRVQEIDKKIAELRNTAQEVEQPVKELVGQVKSASTLYQEGIVANQGQLASVQQQVVVTQRDQTELKGELEANRRTLRAIQGKDLNQMVDEAVRKLFNTSVIKEKVLGWVRGAFTPAAPSTSIDALNPRPIEMVENVATDKTERQVDAAFKRGGK